ncbi:transcription initiation factor IIE subunit beta [Sistotremastrum niveocremeum HHB9708]|uniref:Transcription initiation factor IIE subunit beta n=1 Tax=Sistotremastrum niveocremeum HHB9708 TaxID=1314777 RepID=A0A164Q7G1_9AGAM|nr:transcription initiation factor IIE subunit beta [Sistotremastrum niveocremeum HHB9708]
MSALARDAAKFQSTLKRQNFTSWHSNPAPPQSQADPVPNTPSPPAPPSNPGEPKKKRPKSNIVYSQPADTGTGSNQNTQLVYAVDFLKSNGGNPMRLEDISIHTNIPLTTDTVLLEKFRAHDRIIHDPKTDLYSYRSDFSFRNKGALLTEIQRHTRKGGGLAVRTLKESWKEAPAAIEELEKEGEVLVIRTVKDGQMKTVFWNEVKASEGGEMVEKEFHDLWHSLKVPEEADLVKALQSGGHQTTAGENPVARPNGKKKGKKGAPRQRQARITNTHLKGEIDLSRDYLPG